MMRCFIFLFFVFVNAGCHSQAVDSQIVLVNIDTLNRAGIATEISVINALNPRVIAIDVNFSGRENPEQDLLLFNALDQCKNLVMACEIDKFAEQRFNYGFFSVESEPEFVVNARIGFVNVILETDDLRTLKRFSTVKNVAGKLVYHLAVETAFAYDSTKTSKFVRNHSNIVEVDYRDGKGDFRRITSKEVFSGDLIKEDIEGKIVMFGYLGPLEEDMFYTPLNKAGAPARPDMYGVEYLAYIVAQVLRE